MIRWGLLLVHRWCGLVIAAFLIMAGLTGAVISCDHELDDLLNSHLTKSSSQGTPRPVLELAARVEAQDQRARATYVSRPEERRVGKECRSWWSPHYEKKILTGGLRS